MNLVSLARTFLFLAVSGTLLAGPTKVGADKCKMCHKVQYDSWQATKHAAKGLDCEGCHGAGSEYKSMSVMKDKAAAIKAGLIMPTQADCGKCHGKNGVAAMTPALFTKSHAHKAK